jgi:short-subunit dehydrogenase
MTRLAGSRALVTGATGGIGRAISVELHRQGCELVVTGRREGPLWEVAESVQARAVVADLALSEDVARLVDEAGEIDIFVANAAIPASGDLEEWDQTDIDRAVQVNLGAPIAITRALLPALRDRGWGHLVYVSSLSGKAASRGTAIYSATKFGLRGFGAALRCDLQGSGVGCSVICPGFVRDAGMFADTGVRLPRMVPSVTADRVARAVVRAISRGHAEISVAPLPLRIGASIGGLVPGLSASIQALAGGDLSHRITSAQRGVR